MMNGRYLSIAATGFCCAAISAQWWPWVILPLWQTLLCACGVIFGSFYLLSQRNENLPSPIWLLIGFVSGTSAGILWAASVGQSYLSWQQQNGEIQQDVTIEGRIVDFREYPQYQKLFLAEVELNDDSRWPQHFVLQLSYYQPTKRFRQGQIVRANARIKPARALANPHGFDSQKWLLSKKVIKTGYVVDDAIALVTANTTWRGRLLDKLMRLNSPGEKWLKALIFGDRSDFDSSDWQTLQRTGTAHLFVISGLHLVIVSGFAILLIRALLVCCPRRLRLDDPSRLLWFLVVLITGLYAYFAHWQLAVTRAFSVLLLAAVLAVLNQRYSRTAIFLISLVITLIMEPYAVYGKGLYLSFGAVATILLCHWRWHQWLQHSWWRTLVVFQVLLTLGMLPLVIGLLGQFSVVAPLLNVFLIPVMTLVLVPSCLLSLLVLAVFGEQHTIAISVIELSGLLLERTVGGLQLSEALIGSYAAQNVVWSLPVLVAVYAMALLLIMPPFWGKKRSALVLLLACVPAQNLFAPLRLWQVHVFDVGQGTAVLVTHKGEGMLFDTGASFPSGGNYIESVVQPFLQARNIQLRQVFISHFDNDHAGGISALQANYPQVPIITTENRCRRGFVQRWGRLQLQVLWPKESKLQQLSDNNSSCVIRLSDDQHSVLLTGDIETSVEALLVNRSTLQRETLRSSLLIAPHHGSKSSSSMAFIDAVAPQAVVFTNGWLNRWRFPNNLVVHRYAQRNITAWQTGKHGYISFSLADEVVVEAFRLETRTPWFHKSFVQ